MNKYLSAITTNFVYFGISMAFFVVVTPLAIKVMGEEFYGLWAVISALMLFSNVGTLGISAIVMKFSSEAPAKNKSQIQFNYVITSGYVIVFGMAVITTIILLLARNLIADNINTNEQFREQFRAAVLWIAASIFPQFLTRVSYGFLVSQLRNRTARSIELFSSISLWLGAIGFAWIDKDLVIVAAWCFLNNLIVMGLYVRAIQQFMPFRIQLDMPTLRKMVNFSGYMFLQSLASALFQQFDKLIVSFTLGPSLAGVYSVGTSLALRLSIVIGQATEIMVPYASLKGSLNEGQELYNAFRKLSRYISLILAGMSSLLIIWMVELLSLWISPDFALRYTNAFRILIVAYSLLSLSRPALQTLIGVGRVKYTTMIYLLITLVMLTGVYFMSHRFGFIGAAASNLTMIFLLVFNIIAYRVFQNPLQWQHILADLHLGLFLPILVYGLTLFLFQSNLIIKLMETLALGSFFVLNVAKDNFLRAKLLQGLQLVYKSHK